MRWILILLKEESYYYKRTLIQTLNPLSANVEYINMDHAFFKKKRPTPTTPCLKWAVPKGRRYKRLKFDPAHFTEKHLKKGSGI